MTDEPKYITKKKKFSYITKKKPKYITKKKKKPEYITKKESKYITKKKKKPEYITKKEPKKEQLKKQSLEDFRNRMGQDPKMPKFQRRLPKIERMPLPLDPNKQPKFERMPYDPNTRPKFEFLKKRVEVNKGGRIGLKSGSKGCKLATKGKGRAYGKNS